MMYGFLLDNPYERMSATTLEEGKPNTQKPGNQRKKKNPQKKTNERN